MFKFYININSYLDINPENGVAPSPTPQCSGYGKGILWVILD